MSELGHAAGWNVVTLLLAGALCTPSIAATGSDGAAVMATSANQAKGQEIAAEAWERDRGFGDFGANIKLTIIKDNGDRVRRKLRTRTLETASGDKSISIFDKPNDVKGFVRLTYAHENGQDDQWLYIPDRKRVKRISIVNDATPFMGTEFAFEDLGTQRPEEILSFDYNYLYDEACPAPSAQLQCFVMERVPLNPYSGYSKQVIWIDQEHYRTQKIDYYDKQDRFLKTLAYESYLQFEGRFWRPEKMLMSNHLNGRKTLVEWSNYRFGNGYRASDFKPGSLDRIR
jgi:outer membrane lipoprotein-sorting protein